MNQLKQYIKQLVREAIDKDVNPEGLGRIGLVVKRFPKVKEALERLMSKSYIYFIKDIKVTAPKPTTFNVVLKNNIDFDLIYNGGKKNHEFSAKISGKRYDLQNLGESQRAINAIANLLSLSPAVKEMAAPGGAPADPGAAAFGAVGGGGGFGDLSSPASEVPPGVEPVPLGGETIPGDEVGGEPEGEEIKENFRRIKLKEFLK